MRRPAEALRQNRIKLSLWIAVVEGLLMVVHVIPRLAVYILAVVAVALWAVAGRTNKSYLGRQFSWIFAASQALAVLVPIVWFVAKWVAVVAIAVTAIIALIFLFTERDRTAPE